MDAKYSQLPEGYERVDEQIRIQERDEQEAGMVLPNVSFEASNQEVCRLTVVEHIYHETEDGPYPVSTVPYTRNLKSSEQTYARNYKVGEAWETLDPKWVVDGASLVYLGNREGKSIRVIPTEEELKAMEGRIIELGLEVDVGQEKVVIPFAVIHPRESIRLCPVNLSKYRVRCVAGSMSVKIMLAVIPS